MSIDLVGAVLQSVLGGRRKRSRNALSYLAGGRGMVTANTLLAAAGLAWGAYESWQASNSSPPRPTPSPGAPNLPPLPTMNSASTSGESPSASARLIRLAVAAANADGSMSGGERESIVAQATSAGAGDALVDEMSRPAALADIVSGVSDAGEKTALYIVAFTIVRADEQVSGAERIFLAQLAHLLGLDAQMVAGLEQSVAERIDAEGNR